MACTLFSVHMDRQLLYAIFHLVFACHIIYNVSELNSNTLLIIIVSVGNDCCGRL